MVDFSASGSVGATLQGAVGVLGAVGASDAGDAALLELNAGPMLSRSFAVVSVEGREALSKLFAFDVTVLEPPDADPFGEDLLKQPARVTLRSSAGVARVLRGIVAAIEPTSTQHPDGRRAWRVRVVPRAWLLKRRVTSRVFQDLSVPEILTTVLEGVGVVASWKLARKHPIRAYCVQYQESDYAFLKRLCAEEGIFFFFDKSGGLLDELTGGAASAVGDVVAGVGGLAQGALGATAGGALGTALDAAGMAPGGEDGLVFCDDANFYPALPDGKVEPSASVDISVGLGGVSASAGVAVDAAPPLNLRHVRVETASEHDVFRFGLRESVRPSRVLLRDYDFKRPSVELRAEAGDGGAPAVAVSASVSGGVSLSASASLGSVTDLAAQATGALGVDVGLGGGDDLTVYRPHGVFEDPEVGSARASVDLEQHRRRARVAVGRSACRRLFPGARFKLETDGGGLLAGEYVVTAVELAATTPELARGLAAVDGSEGGAPQSYVNRFECVPAGVAYLPKRPKARHQQALESATVVGPAGEEIYTDEFGRIKVQFHWDLEGARNEQSSCWIRVVQAWAGAGWGMQFIPRVGMEVAVSFLHGDVDKPVVVGCLYNGANPPTFGLPHERSRSGLRTNSYPGGGGHNELSFEDASGLEQVYLHAQRDHDAVVERDRTAAVRRDDKVQVDRHQTVVVGGHESLQVGGDRREAVRGDVIVRVSGSREESVAQDDTLRVEGNYYVTSVSAEQLALQDYVLRVGGRERREIGDKSDLAVTDDYTVRVRGCYTTVVGRHDAKRALLFHAEGRATVQSSDLTEIASEKELILRCGNSRIRLTPDLVELSAGGVSVRSGNTVISVTAEKAKIRSPGEAIFSAGKLSLGTSDATLKLDTEATLIGTKVKFNPPKTGSESDESLTPPTPTKIELVDQNGKPIPGQRFIIHLDGGAEIAGVVDENGKAEVEVEGAASIEFPDLSDVKGA